MRTESKIFLLAALVILAVFAAFLFGPSVKERFEPRPVRAWVAIQAGDGPAGIGVVDVDAGQPYTVHAVLEAEGQGGEPVYYTEAPALEIDGQPVPAERLRRWDRRQEAKVLWFTVEGNVPYLRLDTPDALSRFQITELLRQDLPRTWSVTGRTLPANARQVTREEGEVEADFGLFRYHARIELFDPLNTLVPEERYPSPGAAELEADPASFTTARISLPGALREPSRFFALTHLEPAPAAEEELRGSLLELTRNRLAFSGLPLLGELIAAAGASPESLVWRRTDLQVGAAWGEDVGAGDLLRAGSRWVVLYEDADGDGRLGRDDLCLDFATAASIRPLGKVFASSGGDVEVARLGA